MYGQSSYKSFCSSSALPELSIPPTSDALYQHCRRPNYQAAVMRHFMTGKMCAPSPVISGWHIEYGELTVTWMTTNPAPDRVLQLVHCSCKTSKCETERYSCMSARLSCTDLCWCQNCENVSKETGERAIWDDDSPFKCYANMKGKACCTEVEMFVAFLFWSLFSFYGGVYCTNDRYCDTLWYFNKCLYDML